MSLTNTFEQKLAKNLFLTFGGDNPSSSTDTTIAAKPEIYMGLHVDPNENNPATDLAVDPSTGTVNSNLLEPFEVTGNTPNIQSVPVNTSRATNVQLSVDDASGYHRIPLNDCQVIDQAATASSAFVETGNNGIDTYSDGPLANVNPIKFPTAKTNWNYVQGWFLTNTDDLSVKGDVYLIGAVNNATEITSGDRAIFNTGALAISIE